MTPLFGHHDRLSEAEVSPASTGTRGSTGQRIRVGVVERDNGLVMAKTSQISNALYDLADQNSTTHTVVLPHGTTVKLAAATAPNAGSWRARFEITNPKLGKTVEEKGASAASELASQIDLLALAKIDKSALAKVTEAHDQGDHHGMLVALGLEEERLQEIDVHVSGYITKSGKHVGAYSQIRKSIDGIKPGTTLHFPDGISVRRSPSGKGFTVGASKAPQLGGVHRPTAKAAADDVARKSAGSTDPKSIGGRTAHSIDKGTDINSISNRGDNPKLPGAPHPEDVAERAAKARKEASKRLPSRKQRARNEALAGTKAKIAGLKDGESIEVGTSRVRRVDVKPPLNAQGKPGKGKGGTTYEVTGPGGRRGTGVWTNPELAAKEAHARNEANSNSRSSKPGRRGAGGSYDPTGSPEEQARAMTAGTNHPDPKDWAEMYDELVNKKRSLKVDALKAARAHALTQGDQKMADRIEATMRKAEGRSSKSSRLVPEGDGKRESLGKRIDAQAKRKQVGYRKRERDVKRSTAGLATVTMQPPRSGRASGGAKAGAVDDPNGSKLRAASNDPAEFANEVKGWDEGELRREAKLLPNSSPLYKLIIAELRRKTGGGHAAGKARNRSQGLAESAGLFAR